MNNLQEKKLYQSKRGWAKNWGSTVGLSYLLDSVHSNPTKWKKRDLQNR